MARGARRRRAAAGEEALGDAVFQRMESDNGQTAARPEQPLGGGEAVGQLVKLVVEIEAKALEGAGGGVLLVVVLAAQHAGHEVGKLGGGDNWLLGPPRHDG